MTQPITLPTETTEEVIGNLASLPLAREAMWEQYADALVAVAGFRAQWDAIGERMAAMELDIRDRMVKEGRHYISTGKCEARLEFDTRLKNQYSVAIICNDEDILSDNFERGA